MSAKAAIDWAHAAETAAGVRTPEQASAHTVGLVGEYLASVADPASESLAALDAPPTIAQLRDRARRMREAAWAAEADLLTAEGGHDNLAAQYRALSLGDYEEARRLRISAAAEKWAAGERLGPMPEEEFSDVLREVERMKGAKP